MVVRHQVILSAVLVAQATAFYLVPQTEVAVVSRPLSLLPTEVERWRMAAEYPIEAEVQTVLQADDTTNRAYVSPDGAVNFFVAYFTTFHVDELLQSPNRKMAGGTTKIFDNNPHANSFFTLFYSEVWADHWLYFSGCVSNCNA